MFFTETRQAAAISALPYDEQVRPPCTLLLKRPVTLGTGRSTVVYRRLELRYPTDLEAERAAKSTPGIDAVITLLTLVAAVPQNVIEQLGPRDFVAAWALMNQYLEVGNGK